MLEPENLRRWVLLYMIAAFIWIHDSHDESKVLQKSPNLTVMHSALGAPHEEPARVRRNSDNITCKVKNSDMFRH